MVLPLFRGLNETNTAASKPSKPPEPALLVAEPWPTPPNPASKFKTPLSQIYSLTDPLPIPIAKTPTLNSDIVSAGCFLHWIDAPAMVMSSATYTACSLHAVAGG